MIYDLCYKSNIGFPEEGFTFVAKGIKIINRRKIG